jgi:hypothetical protein
LRWLASFLLISVFVRFFGGLTLSKFGGYSWQAWFYILGGYWEAMLCGLLLMFLRDYFARAALWIGITEALKTSTCRLLVTNIMLVPKDQDLCDYVVGFQTAAPMTALYLGILCWAIGKNWRSASHL